MTTIWKKVPRTEGKCHCGCERTFVGIKGRKYATPYCRLRMHLQRRRMANNQVPFRTPISEDYPSEEWQRFNIRYQHFRATGEDDPRLLHNPDRFSFIGYCPACAGRGGDHVLTKKNSTCRVDMRHDRSVGKMGYCGEPTAYLVYYQPTEFHDAGHTTPMCEKHAKMAVNVTKVVEV